MNAQEIDPGRYRTLIRTTVKFGLILILCSVPVAVGSAESRNLDAFARCITSKDATMYGSFYCAHCDDQKQLFGASFQYIRYIECSVPGSREMTAACRFAQIRYTPTWTLPNGERLVGMQSLEKLSEKTGCRLQ